jgi:hypothetical protein
VNHIEKCALICGYAVQRITHDYGIDLAIATYNQDGEIENGEIRVQVKATDRLRTVAGGAYAVVRIARADFRHWLLEPMPVILILFDAPKETAYWVHVQSYFRAGKGFDPEDEGGMLTVRIPRSNVLDAAAMRQFARYRDEFLEELRRIRKHA